MSARVQILFKLENGQKVVKKLDLIKGSRVTIGRKTADIVIEDIQISRTHCEIDYDGERVRVVDLNSHNGLLVDGRRVSEFFLRDDLEFQVGHTIARVEKVELLSDEEKDVTRSIVSMGQPDAGTDTGIISIDDKTPRMGIKAESISKENDDNTPVVNPLKEKKEEAQFKPAPPKEVDINIDPNSRKTDEVIFERPKIVSVTQAKVDEDLKSSPEPEKKDSNASTSGASGTRPNWLEPFETQKLNFRNYFVFLRNSYTQYSDFVKWAYLDGELKISLRYIFLIAALNVVVGLIGKLPQLIVGQVKTAMMLVASDMISNFGGIGALLIIGWIFAKYKNWFEHELKLHQFVRLSLYFSLMALPFTLVESAFGTVPYVSALASIAGMVSIYPFVLSIFYFYKITGLRIQRLLVFSLLAVAVSFGTVGVLNFALFSLGGFDEHVVAAPHTPSENSNQKIEELKKIVKPRALPVNPYTTGQSFTLDFILSTTAGPRSGELTVEVTESTPEKLAVVTFGQLDGEPFQFSFEGWLKDFDQLDQNLSKARFQPEDLLSLLFLPIMNEEPPGPESKTSISGFDGTCFDINPGQKNPLSKAGYIQYCRSPSVPVPLLLRGVLRSKSVGFSIQLRR
ncbi:MAG: FHA domain-containing protein [Bdellovibrionales bacterium]|nr:FHA domain-containing protein [Bdellovibrionales bacterium]